jgi:hypothetical protein
MRLLSSVSCLSTLCGLLVAASTSAFAQDQLVAKIERPAELAGLYRVEVPSALAPHKIKFLRLLADGRARWETIDINAATSAVNAHTSIGPFSEKRWHLRAVAAGRAPQLCFPQERSESCYAFHAETPTYDLLLFAPDANWSEPTIILRRERASNTR